MSADKTDAKSAVLLVGSGYGALKVAEDLAQSGIPVVWVTRAPHFLALPQGLQSFDEWPDDLNFQFRPLYLRVTRHPRVTPITRGRVESLRPGPEGYEAVVVRDPRYIDYDLCTGCGRCMEVCPLDQYLHPPLTRSPAYCPSRALELDKRKPSPCRTSCPLGVNVQAYMALTAAGRFEEALEVIRQDNPLPGVCGRVCHHPCEESCRRRELDQPLAIRDLKRFLADHRLKQKTSRPPRAPQPRRQEKIAVIGSGPAGLTAAHFLSRAGFGVTIFEALPEPGGMLRWGIPAYRLPREVLAQEIQEILDAGVELRTGVRVGQDLLFTELVRQYRSIFLAVGAQQSHGLGVPGEETAGVLAAVEMLRAFNLGEGFAVGKKVAVVGGGNSAIDAARTAIRRGADAVTIYYRRERRDMPAGEDELQAAEAEGVKIEYRVGPVRVVAAEGRVAGLELIRMQPGEVGPDGRRRPEPVSGSEFQVAADTVISAIGQRPVLDFLPADCGVKLAKTTIAVDDRFQTARPGVLAGGDAVTGPGTVIEAMAQGRRAAAQIIEHLTGTPAPELTRTLETRAGEDYVPISESVAQEPRQEMAQRQPKARRRDFSEVDLGLSEAQAVAEAKRCLQCSGCCECRVCEASCADIGAINHFRELTRITVISPSVIVADPDELPAAEALAGPEIYQVGDFRQSRDLMDVMMAGSAAAGKAMARAVRLRPEERPEMKESALGSDEMRLGVFLCACNGTMAPPAALERIRELSICIPGVVSSEVIFSACHPAGADQIAKSVGEHQLSRVVLASCVCCPLEFHCISCNDQRSRVRLHLFDRLGLSRGRFEMINLRDHLLSGDPSEDEIVDRARDLLRGAFIRASFMGPLSQGTTRIGNSILILGGSEVGMSCALNLDLQGFKVRLVHRARAKDEELPEALLKRPADLGAGRNITHVESAVVEKIQGQVGDFTVVVKEGQARRRWKADIVCLTDENLLSLAIKEDMLGLKKFYRYDFAFFHTPQIGLYRVMPRTLQRVKAFEAGAALAAQVATAAAEAFMKDHELSPRVDPERCRGCGRCAEICPFDAIQMEVDDQGLFTARVVRHNCVGCGGCVGRCPVTALDMPYFSNQLLEEIVAGVLSGER